MTNNKVKEVLSIVAGSEEEKQRTIKKYVPKELRYEPKPKDKNGRFVVKTKLGYYNGSTFVKDRTEATIYNNYDDAKEVAKMFGKVVRL